MRTDGLTRHSRGLGGLALTVLVLLLTAAGARADLVTPKLATAASASVAVGGALTDTAILAGASPAKPGGTITFALYDVTDPKCAGTPVFTQTVPLAVPTVSAPFTAAKAGSYNWIATYSGDPANAKVAGKCGDPGETVAVSAAQPTITTVASPSVALGGAVNDTAVLTGGYKPGGTVTFKLYGPADTACAGPPVFTSFVGLASPTVSGAYAPTAAGTYRFVATYSGDAANAGASSGCADPSEAVVITAAGTKPGTSPPPPPACDAAAMARDLVNSLVAVLTGAPGGAFKAACSAGVRIVLRAKEIRPGNPGFPHGDGFTTMGNTLTHTTSAGQIAFSFSPQGIALRNYAHTSGASLTVFAIVHVRPDKALQSSESVAIFTLR
ncbi:MAG TPA: Ig-like domain-containing protein [Solirubrobacteraceae bacterium]|nr:Ig-like domain-containing protein [Solirubrobacteraceae bacterium]